VVGCGLGGRNYSRFGAVMGLNDDAESIALLVAHLADDDILEFARSKTG